MKYLKTFKANALTTFVIAVICFIILLKSNYLKNIGMAAVVVMWMPIFLGIVTFLIYSITNYFTKKYAYIVTILGGLWNILYVISIYFETK